MKKFFEKVAGLVAGNADKVAHAFASWLVLAAVATGIILYRMAGGDVTLDDWWTAVVSGAGVAVMTGIFKEFYDLANDGDWSVGDFLADLAGIVLGGGATMLLVWLAAH